MKLGMPISSAFKVALATWKSWVENTVNPNRTKVFFRTFESTHWRCVSIDLLHCTYIIFLNSQFVFFFFH